MKKWQDVVDEETRPWVERLAASESIRKDLSLQVLPRHRGLHGERGPHESVAALEASELRTSSEVGDQEQAPRD